MNLFGIGKKVTDVGKYEENPKTGNTSKGLEKPNIEQVEDSIVVDKTDAEQVLEITKGDESVLIHDYELNIKRNHDGVNSNYRIVGTNGSIVITEKELDYIYSEFKRFNKV